MHLGLDLSEERLPAVVKLAQVGLREAARAEPGRGGRPRQRLATELDEADERLFIARQPQRVGDADADGERLPLQVEIHVDRAEAVVAIEETERRLPGTGALRRRHAVELGARALEMPLGLVEPRVGLALLRRSLRAQQGRAHVGRDLARAVEQLLRDRVGALAGRLALELHGLGEVRRAAPEQLHAVGHRLGRASRAAGGAQREQRDAEHGEASSCEQPAPHRQDSARAARAGGAGACSGARGRVDSARKGEQRRGAAALADARSGVRHGRACERRRRDLVLAHRDGDDAVVETRGDLHRGTLERGRAARQPAQDHEPNVVLARACDELSARRGPHARAALDVDVVCAQRGRDRRDLVAAWLRRGGFGARSQCEPHGEHRDHCEERFHTSVIGSDGRFALLRTGEIAQGPIGCSITCALGT